jgi:hypothetical protein
MRALSVLLLAYAAATLFHFGHNAEFVADYPNLPAWLSRAKIYAAWLSLSAVGAAGYLLLLRGYELSGLSVLGVYAGFGFDGFSHYGLAPASAHTAAMNLSIWLEAACAAVLLVALASLIAKRARGKATA